MTAATSNKLLNDIAETVEQLSKAEQERLFKSLRLKKYRCGKIKISNPPKRLKPLTMKEIDEIKLWHSIKPKPYKVL